jgi:UDP-N-acetylmuramyl pentapeptide phosphotransferase/UDP-N-acetylglucosamine-1-phosphate transferase
MPSWIESPLPAGLAAAVVTWLVAFLVCEWARRRRILDLPNERSSHVTPTPRLGGIGIVCGVLAGTLLSTLARGTLAPAGLTLVLPVALALAAVSLSDDLRGLPAMFRLVCHVIAAAVTVAGLDVAGRVHAAGAEWWLAWTFAIAAGTWIVYFVNAFNFMDGIDGIAAGQALVAGLGWTLVGAALGESGTIQVGAVVAGASIGFLVLNWSPARVFMGDVGSAFLGYLLAVLPLLGAGSPVPAAAPALLLVWPFLVDTAFTLVRRARRGERLTEAHRSHLYQRISAPALGGRAATHAHVAGAYMALAAIGAPSAWAAATGHWGVAAAGVLAGAILAVASWRMVVTREASA